MIFEESIKGRPVYAGGSSTVNIRKNVSTESAVIGNVVSGGLLGTATGNRFPDLDHGPHDWYEIRLPDNRPGYVRKDAATFTAPAKTSSSAGSPGSGSGEYLKTAFDSKNGGFPKWAAVAVAVCFAMVGAAILFLVKKRKGK